MQKLSLAALEQQRNFVYQDTTSVQPSPPATRQTMEVMTKYLMNAMDTWGSNVSHLMTVHLGYILPFIHDSHIPTLARLVLTGC